MLRIADSTKDIIDANREIILSQHGLLMNFVDAAIRAEVKKCGGLTSGRSETAKWKASKRSANTAIKHRRAKYNKTYYEKTKAKRNSTNIVQPDYDEV